MAIDYMNPDWCCIHGVVNHLCRKCKDPSLDKPVVPPAMSRALEPEMYNVLAGEIRELGDAITKLPTEEGVVKGFAHLKSEVMLRSVDFEHNLSNALCQLEERLNGRILSLNGEVCQLKREVLEAQQLIMQKLERLTQQSTFWGSGDDLREVLEAVKLINLRMAARKRQPKPVRRKGRK